MKRDVCSVSAFPATAALVFADGTVFMGHGLGAEGRRIGELCFNTAMTGYQEILTDPSYANQVIVFTFPHIGNVGTNLDDIETLTPSALGLVLRVDITEPSNYRSIESLATWLVKHGLIGISGVDTRRITRHIRDTGPQHVAVVHSKAGDFEIAQAREEAAAWLGLKGLDLAQEVCCRQTYRWDETRWNFNQGYDTQHKSIYHVVTIDFGVKRNILRSLVDSGCRVTVVPGTAEAEDILRHDPDGILLSNGPGDPAATGRYAVPMIQQLLHRDLPIFGICLGYQMLALALGARTEKMHMGHRGANHPVQDLDTRRVEITSQNHGFIVIEDSLPRGLRPTHRSLFDGTLEGVAVDGRPIFAVQYHPEASPGPQDSHYLFKRFVDFLSRHAKTH